MASDNKLTESILWQKGYRINSKNEWYLPHKTNNSTPVAEHKPSVSHDSVGKSEGADNGAGFRVVRIKSYRRNMVDERNIYDKYIVDALVRAKLLRDDTPKWCRIEVTQEKVYAAVFERTEIEITESAPDPQPSQKSQTAPE